VEGLGSPALARALHVNCDDPSNDCGSCGEAGRDRSPPCPIYLPFPERGFPLRSSPVVPGQPFLREAYGDAPFSSNRPRACWARIRLCQPGPDVFRAILFERGDPFGGFFVVVVPAALPKRKCILRHCLTRSELRAGRNWFADTVQTRGLFGLS
jgi:hypothetical protein